MFAQTHVYITGNVASVCTDCKTTVIAVWFTANFRHNLHWKQHFASGTLAIIFKMLVPNICASGEGKDEPGCAYIQFHQSLSCSHTQTIEYRMAKGKTQSTRDTKCSMHTRIIKYRINVYWLIFMLIKLNIGCTKEEYSLNKTGCAYMMNYLILWPNWQLHIVLYIGPPTKTSFERISLVCV